MAVKSPSWLACASASEIAMDGLAPSRQPGIRFFMLARMLLIFSLTIFGKAQSHDRRSSWRSSRSDTQQRSEYGRLVFWRGEGPGIWGELLA
jgi:hypothetical protein